VIGWKSHATEVKYGLISVVLFGGLILLDAVDAFGGLGNDVVRAMDTLASLGYVGIFVIALVANASILIQIPYTLPLLSAALGGASLSHMLTLGLVAGVGAGIGEIISYKVADVVIARNPELPRGAMFQWVARNVDTHPRRTWLAIFAVAATPLPDDAVVVPLAVVKYGMRRFAPPMFLGKITHNVVVAVLFTAFASWASTHVSKTTSTDLAIALVIAFVLVVFYQAEKARQQSPALEPQGGP
jgi:uncharacterized membrane protein YdjX (TVP38/TMEM64 family)